jgi:hypothetical protein
MKGLFILILMSALVFAGPSTPYMVHGKSMIGGVPAQGMTIKLTNEAAGSSDNFVSTSAGEYGFRLDYFPNGYDLGDSLTLEYCIADTRCDQNTISNTVTGTGGLRWDIDAPYNPISSCGAYVVYGTVVFDGRTITSGTMNIMNLETGNSINVEIDSEGYQGNLGSINGCWETGDDIRLGYGEGSYDFVVIGNGGLQVDYIYTTPPASEQPGGGGGDGGTPGTKPDKDEEEIPEDYDEKQEEEAPPEEAEEEVQPEEITHQGVWIIVLIVIIVGVVAYFVMRKK